MWKYPNDDISKDENYDKLVFLEQFDIKKNDPPKIRNEKIAKICKIKKEI